MMEFKMAPAKVLGPTSTGFRFFKPLIDIIVCIFSEQHRFSWSICHYYNTQSVLSQQKTFHSLGKLYIAHLVDYIYTHVSKQNYNQSQPSRNSLKHNLVKVTQKRNPGKI